MMNGYILKGLFDGKNDHIHKDVIIVTEDGLISGIFPRASQNTLLERGVVMEDFGCLYALPGLIDGHVHLMLPGDGTAAEDAAKRSVGESCIQAAKNAQQALQHGITTLRDCGGLPDVVFPLKAAIESGSIAGPDVIICGSPLTVTSGHVWCMGGEVDTPDEIVKRIRLEHKRGSDFVKLIATGGGTKNVIQHKPMLSFEQMSAAVQEAHRLGKYATAHVCTTKTADTAVNAGVDMLEHMLFADKENKLDFDAGLAEKIAERGIPVCHTMSVLPISVARYDSLNRALTAAEQAEYDMLQRFNETIFEGFRRTCDSIVYIPGTDSGWRYSPFGSLARGISLMAQLGLSNSQALASATGVAAKVLGISHKLGTLEPGKKANFILTNNDPLDDLSTIEKPCAVFKNGTRIVQRVQNDYEG